MTFDDNIKRMLEAQEAMRRATTPAADLAQTLELLDASRRMGPVVEKGLGRKR